MASYTAWDPVQLVVGFIFMYFLIDYIVQQVLKTVKGFRVLYTTVHVIHLDFN